MPARNLKVLTGL